MDDSKQEGNNQRVAPYFMIRLCGPFRAERRVGTGYESVRIPEWGGSSYPRLLLKALQSGASGTTRGTIGNVVAGMRS